MRKTFSTISFFILVLLLVAAASDSRIYAQKQGEIVSGEYDSLLLGVNAQGKLTGYFDEGTGDDGNGNPRFSCIFFISGERQTGGGYKIKTWFPGDVDDVIEGELKSAAVRGEKAVNLHLNGEHGGCWNVAPALKEKNGVDFSLTTAGKWESIRVISPAKAYFYVSAEARAPQKIYAVKGDVVRVWQTKDRAAEVSFVNDSGKTTKGWMKTKDFYAAAP